MTQDAKPASQPPQRNTRAPAEGADPGDAAQYDHTAADQGGPPQARSLREPAEGKPQAADGSGGRAEHAGSGNSLGDGRTAGGAQNIGKRRELLGD